MWERAEDKNKKMYKEVIQTDAWEGTDINDPPIKMQEATMFYERGFQRLIRRREN